MLHIFHGDNLVSSRQAYRDKVDSLKSENNLDEYSFDGRKLNYIDLVEVTQEVNLFDSSSIITIDGFLKTPQSAKKKEIISYITNLSENSPDIFFWESASLTKTQLKVLPKALEQEFKVKKSIFAFVESIKPRNGANAIHLLEQASSEESTDFAFVMMVRQVRMLLQAHGNGTITGPPWLVQKVKSQANMFTIKDLKVLYSKLCTIDAQLKSGKALLPLATSLDLLLAKL